MNIAVLLGIVYLIAAAGIVIMKKIQPEDKIYPIWVAFVCIVLTAFVIWYVS